MITSTMAPPPPAPAWARRSITEDGGITHEMVSTVRPLAAATWPPTDGTDVRPVEVSVSVVDRLTATGWVRSTPTVQVEGGSFPCTQVPTLLQALHDVLAATARH